MGEPGIRNHCRRWWQRLGRSYRINQALLIATKDLASVDLPHRRDGLFLALHRLVTAMEAEGGVSVG
jgi:hypothetical protein